MPQNDETEEIRRLLIESGLVDNVAGLVQPYWNTEELIAEFEVIRFFAPFVQVRRRKDGVVGTMMFRHSPRLYFGWKEDENG